MGRKWRFRELESDWFKGGVDGKVVNIRDFSSIKLCMKSYKKNYVWISTSFFFFFKER